VTERTIDDSFWDEGFTQSLPTEGKTLYIWSFTNKHCNPAGLYKATLKTIAFETDIDIKRIPELLDLLQLKLKYYPDNHLLWVKNFLKRQSKSPKFIQAAAKALTTINCNGAINELLEYNRTIHSISIPYQYYMDNIKIPTGLVCSNTDTITDSCSSEDKEVFKGKKGKRGKTVVVESLKTTVEIYESNIGIITPIVAEELKDIANEYPIEWFGEAIKIACDANVRKLSYIRAILERWKTEGKDKGQEKTYKHKRVSEDPNKFVKGKYGHMVKR